MSQFKFVKNYLKPGSGDEPGEVINAGSVANMDADHELTKRLLEKGTIVAYDEDAEAPAETIYTPLENFEVEGVTHVKRQDELGNVSYLQGDGDSNEVVWTHAKERKAELDAANKPEAEAANGPLVAAGPSSPSAGTPADVLPPVPGQPTEAQIAADMAKLEGSGDQSSTVQLG